MSEPLQVGAGEELINLSKILGTKIDKWIEENILPTNSQPTEMYDSLRESLEGGKGLRELATYLVAESLGTDPDKTIPLGAGSKFAQTSFVILDGINDDEYFRRGKLALFRRIGVTKAQLVYSEALVKSFQCLNAAKPIWGENITDRILNIWTQMMVTTGEGQYSEYMKTMKRDFRNWTEEMYFADATEKAGDYTLGTPFAAGAIIANKVNGYVNDLRTLGRIVGGRVFQPIDDVLNLKYLLTLDPQLLIGKRVSDLQKLEKELLDKILGKYGKEPGGDILEGKHTLPANHYISQIMNNQSKLEKFQNTFGKRDSFYDQVIDLVYEMKDKDSIEYGMMRAKEEKEKIGVLIEDRFKDSLDKGKKIMNLIDFVYNRTW